jgi:hypothetical protein
MTWHSDRTTLPIGGLMLDRKWRIVIVAVLFSLGWYLFFALLDRATVSHMRPVSVLCLNDYLPPGTIHNPEGMPFPPAGECTYFPLGIECVFTMTDGSTQRLTAPRYEETIIAGTPLLVSTLWGTWQVISSAKATREHHKRQ